ncbi:immunoglobulin superfamily member 5 isoform X3 [Oreochromis aureus]|uniref:immunoglobulin superfamily member 5 isoform X3 n=1 Tax=Oreochromis aureus TaxID=47969 RepID=UPI001952EB07|nr:immunoglobulin superfamily member 5 isoform X3 [Oreochromis aureus]
MDTFPLLVLLLSWRTEVEAQIKLFPENLTVLRGEKARFTCTPSNSQWTAMIWLLNGEVALTISNEHGVLQSPDTNLNLMAEKKKDGWMLVLNNTERHDQGEVTCDLQGIDRKTARLFVQEKGSVKILGNNRLAFQRDSVLFECEAAGWHPEPVLKWEVNNKEVSPSEYNISSEESRESLFTVTSNLSVLAAKSSHVDCLASVSALPEPLKSTISLKVFRLQTGFSFSKRFLTGNIRHWHTFQKRFFSWWNIYSLRDCQKDVLHLKEHQMFPDFQMEVLHWEDYWTFSDFQMEILHLEEHQEDLKGARRFWICGSWLHQQSSSATLVQSLQCF